MNAALVLSCEHASAAVPRRYRAAFRGAAAALRSHRGSDLGAAALARQLARALAAPLRAATSTRLLVDANRSATHPRVFSEWSRRLPDDERRAVLARHWAPHRDAVERLVAAVIARAGACAHVSVHSFTPALDGVVRDVDVAWLYDPARAGEKAFVDRWRAALQARLPALRLRRNHPYRGVADGLTTHLRRRFAGDRYLGVELEVNQRYPLRAPRAWAELRAALCASLREALAPPA